MLIFLIVYKSSSYFIDAIKYNNAVKTETSFTTHASYRRYITDVILYPGITIFWRPWENTRSKRTRCETLDFAVFESSFIEDV